MSHNDKTAVDKAVPPSQVDIDNLLNDIHPDREQFTKQSKLNSAVQSRQMAETGILPTVTFA